MVGWDGGGVDAVADTGNDSTDDELGELSVSLDGRDLDDDPDNHDKPSDNHGFPSAEEITTGEDADGAEKAADFVDGGDETLHGGALGLGEVVLELGGGDDAAHDALIVAEEEKACCCDGGNGP